MFDALCCWDNLWLAYHNAAYGKRRRASAASFEHRVADHIVALCDELRAGSYRPGAYCHFHIREPKHRLISAAPFRDRVVHHALCQMIQPRLEAHFFQHSYANRIGKGTHRALAQCQQWLRRYRYALRGDVVQHFAAIDHAILAAILARHIDEPEVLALIESILSSGAGVLAGEYSQVYFSGDDLFAATRPRGLPIGNLTSQLWSNVYLNDFDWFVARELGCRAYLRYVDDFVLFGDDKGHLWECKQAIVARLATLRLTLHDAEMQVVPSACGIPWLGFVVYPDHRLVKRRNAVNFTRRLARNITDYRAGRMSFAELDASVQGWINHVQSADTWGLREHLFSTHPLRGEAL